MAKKISNGKEDAVISAKTTMDVVSTAETMQESISAIVEGMQMLFAGYAKVFTGLAQMPKLGIPVPDAGQERLMEQEQEQTSEQHKEKEADNNGGVRANASEDKEEDEIADNDAKSADIPKTDGDAAVTDDAAADAASSNANASAVTKDDLLREIQAKFRKDRKNQEKVRSILLAYGASGLSLLDEAKYADFLNDVRQL